MPPEESREDKLKKLRSKLEDLNRSFVKDRPASFSTEDVRKAVRRARRGPSPKDPTPPSPSSPSSPPSPVKYSRLTPRVDSSPRPPIPPSPRPNAVSLEDAVTGHVTISPMDRPYLLVTTEVATVEDREDLNRTLTDLLATPDSPMRLRLDAICDTPVTDPSSMVFMDIETTGLSNVPLFLIGIMVWEDGGFFVRQYLARNYAEEAAVISAYVERTAASDVLVTFNGKSFDAPYIRTRSAATGVKYAAPPNHVDLLHESRKIWRHRLPNCKLQTLEDIICGHGVRVGDIPGAEIGDAYHAFVRTGDAWQIVQILKHNMLDLVTLAEILCCFE